MDIWAAKMLPRPAFVAGGDVESDAAGVLTNFFLEQEEPTPVIPAAQAVPWLRPDFNSFQPVIDDNMVCTLAAVFIEPQDPVPTPPAQESVPWLALPFLEDADIMPAVNIVIEPQDPIPTPPAQQSVPWLPFYLGPNLDDEIGATFADQFAEQEEFASFVSFQTESVPWLPRPFLDDEISTGLADFVLEQEEPPVAVPPVQFVPWVSLPFPYDELAATLANRFIEQEEFLLPATVAVVWTPRPQLDEETWVPTPTVPVEEEFPPFVPAQPAIWTPLPFLDDEISTNLAAVSIDQEEPWIAQVQAIPWTPALRVMEDEKFSTSLSVDDEAGYSPTAVNIPWSARPFPDDEIQGSGGLFYFATADEDWFPPAVQSRSWTPFPPGEENDIGFSVTVVHGDDDPAPFVPLQSIPVWSTAAATDDETSAGLVVFVRENEESFGDLFRTTAITWLARPAQDEEVAANLFTIIEQEDFFPPAALPKVWTPQPFSDDEIGASLKYFWLDQQDPWQGCLPFPTGGPGPAWPWSAVTFTDDEQFRPIGPRIDDESAGTVPPVMQVPWTAFPGAADDETHLPVVNVEQEDGWTGQTVSVPWLSRPHADDEIGAGLAVFPIEQDDPIPIPLPTWPAIWISTIPAADEHALQRPTPDEEVGAVLMRTNLPWATAVPVTDAEELHAAGIEEEWTALWLPAQQPARQPGVFLDDEQGAGLVRFTLEQEEPWPELWLNQLETMTWSPVAFIDDETNWFTAVLPGMPATDIYAPVIASKGVIPALTATGTIPSLKSKGKVG